MGDGGAKENCYCPEKEEKDIIMIRRKRRKKALRNGPLGALRQKKGKRHDDEEWREKNMCDFLYYVFEICETSYTVEILQFQR